MTTTTQEVAIVTGAGSGIGAQIAQRLSARGAAIAMIDYNPDGLAATTALLDQQGGLSLGLLADVRDDDQVRSVVERAVAELGPLRTVVSCAGVEVLGSVTELSPDDWQRSIDINLTGVYHLARHTVPELLSTGGGSFTAIASDAGVTGAQGYAAYCAAKHGVIGLIRSMALDHGNQGIRSNAICPSMVETPMAERIFDTAGGADYYAASVPLGRFARPDEIAAAAAHLSSAEASYVNGMTYLIDGGATAGYYENATTST